MRSKELKDLKAQLQQKVTEDAAFRSALLADARGAIRKEFGIDVRDDINIVVHENTSDTVHFVIPDRHSDHGTLSDEELAAVAGGRLGAWSCSCGPSIG
jgi:hypothetical protein